MKITKKQIDKVLEGFPFGKAAEIYSLLDWKFYDKGIPNSDQLKELAIRLIGDLRKSEGAESIRAGGLRVSRYLDEEKVFCLKLELIALSSVHDNLDEDE